MKIQCTLPEFEDCWIEVSEKWSGTERNTVAAPTAEQWLDLFHSKVLGCHLRDCDGQALSKPVDVTWPMLDNLDVRLAGFVMGCLNTACAELLHLGKVARRVSFNGAATEKPG